MTRTEVIAYIGLGGNLGAAAQAVLRASQALDGVSGVRLLRTSRLYKSAPVDSSGPDYINAVAEVATTLPAPQLLSALQAIENAAGRERPYANAPRTLDLDMLLYGDARIDSPQLTVPHPRMQQRAFVLRPLSELVPAQVSAQALQAVGDQVLGLWSVGD